MFGTCEDEGIDIADSVVRWRMVPEIKRWAKKRKEKIKEVCVCAKNWHDQEDKSIKKGLHEDK